jgi:DNA polymerase
MTATARRAKPQTKRTTPATQSAKRVMTRSHTLNLLYAVYASDPNFTHLRYRTRFVPGQGSLKPRVMFIGESPTQEEEHMQAMFVGPIGRVFDDMLRSVDLKREHVFMTHLLKYRTPNGRDPRPDEAKAAVGYLKEEIAILKPSLIVPMGRFPVSVLVPNAHIAHVHGQVLEAKGRLVVPMLNPVSAIVNPTLRKVLFDDMMKIGELV